MKSILITGGSGFIGRNLAEKYESKYMVFSPSSQELDVRNIEEISSFIKRKKIEIIIHTATYTKRAIDPLIELEYNLQMICNLEKVSSMVDKVLSFGSGAEFNKSYSMEMINENEFGRSIPRNAYGFSKYITNLLIGKTDNMYNMRLFGVFGKYEDWKECFISNLCCKAIYDLPLNIRMNCMFDFLDVDDLSNVIEWFIEQKPLYHSYNITTGNPISLLEIAREVNKISGKKMNIDIAKSGWAPAYTANNSRLQNELQYKFTPIEFSIKKLYNWYEKKKMEIDYNILKTTR